MTNICKSQRIKKRQLRNKPKRLCKRLEYDVVSENPRVLRLKDGTLLRQPIEGIDLYLSEDCHVYGINYAGLRQRHIDYTKKNNYCKRITTGRGHHQGQTYPRVEFMHKKYPMHLLIAILFKGGVPKGKVADHINGNIDDFSPQNIRVIDIPENHRCGGILRRYRNASIRLNNPRMNPINIPQEKLLRIFAEFRKPKSGKVKDEYLLSLLD